MFNDVHEVNISQNFDLSREKMKKGEKNYFSLHIFYILLSFADLFLYSTLKESGIIKSSTLNLRGC